MSEKQQKNIHIDSVDPLSGQTDWTLDIINDLFDDDIVMPHKDDLVDFENEKPVLIR